MGIDMAWNGQGLFGTVSGLRLTNEWDVQSNGAIPSTNPDTGER